MQRISLNEQNIKVILNETLPPTIYSEKEYPLFKYFIYTEYHPDFEEALRQQKNYIMIENKYNDLVQEIQELKTIKIKYDELIEERYKEKKENIEIMNKLKSQMNEVIKQNIILKNQLDIKNKENEELKYFINEYKIKYEKV